MNKKILIIDDNEETIMSLEYALKKDGFQVECAYDGQEGYTKAAESPPDLIVLDVMMPVMDGYTMNRHLKENPQTRDIPVIIITASEDRRLGFGLEQASRVEAVMRKPFQYREFISKVREITEK